MTIPLIVFFLVCIVNAQEPTQFLLFPNFTCWFSNFTPITPTQYTVRTFLVFGYTNNGSNRTVPLSTSNTSNRNRMDPVGLPQTQITTFKNGTHLFAFEYEMNINLYTTITWFIGNRSMIVSKASLIVDNLCIEKYAGCPGEGLHNDSSLFNGFCDTTAVGFCRKGYQCNTVSRKCEIWDDSLCPANTSCVNTTLSCIPLTPPPSLAPTPSPTIPFSSPPPTLTAKPTPAPTLKPVTLAPTPAPTLAPTPSPTRRPTSSPTKRPTPAPTPASTVKPNVIETPSATSIAVRVVLPIASALGVLAFILYGLARSTTQQRLRR